MMSKRRVIAGFLIAPLGVPFIYSLGLAIASMVFILLTQEHIPLTNLLQGSIEAFLATFLMTAFYAYGVALVIGVPVFFLFKAIR